MKHLIKLFTKLDDGQSPFAVLMIRLPLLLTFLLIVGMSELKAQDLKTGEYAVQSDGSPAMIGQCVQDHFFVRNVYEVEGQTMSYDNEVSFKSGTPQVVAFWVNDDQIYTNTQVQALPPVPCYTYGNELYKEITYSSAQFNIYLPMTMTLVRYKFPGSTRAVAYAPGNRLSYDANVQWAERDGTIVVDGIEYRVYNVLITNTKGAASHFSGNEDAYAENGGALMKDDAPLFYLAVQNANQADVEGRLADMIIANQEFGICETNLNGWDVNHQRYIYGYGGDNVEQRFQLYTRVALWGSSGISSHVFVVNNIYYEITGNNTVSVTYRRDNNYYSGNIIIPGNVYYNGINYIVSSIGTNAFKGSTGLTSVTIPQTVNTISNCAFQGCTSLKIVNYNAVYCANFSSVESDRPFNGCTNISTINIGDNVTRIPAYFACGLTNVKHIHLPGSVTSIGKSASITIQVLRM